ncbi:MAG: ABC transporter permease, partial [Thermoguttaceae bacterium]|nr:ABC transporter permease [Thermoguttaceae bacterium]
MKKIFAILRKEYMETRTESLVFLLIGLAAPYLILLGFNAQNEYSAKELLASGSQWLPAGALFALWINLVILAATAFSRERENGTLETLRRTVKDWRLAAFGKFGYVLISTAVMAAVFALVWAVATRIFSGAVVWLDFISGGELKKAGYEYLNDFPLRDLQLVLLDSFVWGIFWSGRVKKQVGAIFSAVLCAVATGWVVGFAAKEFNLDPNAALACRMALLAVVLAFAPVRSRFGFRDFARAESSSEPRGPIDAKAWQEFDAIKPGGRPISAVGALLERAFGSMSLYGATFAALMIELAFLFVLRGIVFMFPAAEIPVTLLTPWALLILCSAFGSGLFVDVRDGNSPVRQRLPLFPTTYWLCNAFAYAVVSAVLYAAAWLAMPSDGWAADFDLTFAALLWALSFATLLWAAALKGSRVTVAFVSFAVNFAVFLLLGAYVWNKAAGFESAEHAVKASFAATFAAFVAASYITVRRKLLARRAPIASSVPLALVAAVVACAACWDRPEFPQPTLEELTVAKQIELESTETPEEYLKRVEQIKHALEEEISERVFPKSMVNAPTVDELNDAALHLIRTYEAAKLRAAAPDAAAIAETNFYNTLNKIQNY